MSQKKYVSLSKLQTFLVNLSNKFAALSHTHTIADLSDYTVDTELSSTSTNPVANSALEAEFEAISQAMGALDLAIDGKADATHDHNDLYYTESEIDQKLSAKADSSHTHSISNVTNLQDALDAKVPTSRTINNKPLVENITLSASDVGAAAAAHNHDDSYYTETEMDAMLESKSDASHNHDSAYYGKSAGETLANTLADVKEDVDAFFANATISTAAKDTLKEIQDYIDSDVSAAAEMTASIANKADKTHAHKVADITDLTVTATELNYMDGVKSSVQAQLDEKAVSNHVHSAANITSGTLSTDRLPTIPISKGGTNATTVEKARENLSVYSKEEHNWTLIYDSGEIPEIVNSISGIDVSGYTNFEVLVNCYNDGDSYGSRTGSVIFAAQNGKTYQFPVWTNMFSKGISTVAAMAQFKLVDGWLVCPYASKLVDYVDIFSLAEGGTALNLTHTGSGMMRCTSPLSTLTISNLDQNSKYYFGSGSRVMVWGWKA